MKHDTEGNKEKMLIALEKHLGIVTPACKEVGISRNQFYNWCKNDPDFKRRVDELDDVTLDFVETKLLEKIKAGDNKSIMFYMKYKARKRGYTDSIDVTTGGDKITDIKINIVRPNGTED